MGIGDGKEHGDDPAWDAVEAEALYELLEREVIPEFYNRDEKGIPVAWVARIRESMARLTPRFSANRTVREYTEKYYIPAATAYAERAAGKGAMSVQMVNWRSAIKENWSSLRFGEVKAASDSEKYLFEVQVYFNNLNPDSVRVELYAEGVNGSDPVRQAMSRGQQLVGAENGYIYNAMVTSTRPVTDYTARIIPHFPGVAIPLEVAQILWQR